MKKLYKDNISKEMIDGPVYLYGAGYTAKICVEALENAGVNITALIDDDTMKQGTKVLSYNVLSYEDFEKACLGRECVHVILTSIYGKQIYNRLKRLSNIAVWEMYEWYMELISGRECVFATHFEDEKLECYKINTDNLKAYLADDESKDVFDGIYRYFQTNDINYLADICTTDESYFTKEVKSYLKNKEITLIDAGAYDGELLGTIINSKLNVKDWYCFELAKNNYERLKNNVSRSNLPENLRCMPENMGLWDERKEFTVIGQEAVSRISEDGAGNGEICRVDTIDNYFQDIHVDMIKMDIEGAEMNALKGGIKTIRRDMPLLAISIYHYVEDYYRIMQFLLDNAGGGGYKYYIRHHALVYGETVLYAIPGKVQ